MERLEGLRVVVVDDNDDIRETVCDALRFFRCAEVRAAATREAGLAALADGARCDILICDWNLGGQTGADVLRAARAADVTTGRVLLTAATPRELGEAIRDGLAHVVLRKPFGLCELRAAMARALPPERAPARCTSERRAAMACYRKSRTLRRT
jgi:CheY-like chemotaxis protein